MSGLPSPGDGTFVLEVATGAVRAMRPRGAVLDVAYGWGGRRIAVAEASLAAHCTHAPNGGTVSIPGVYGGLIDKLPMGAVMNRSLTIRTGQTHVQRYLKPLLERIQNGEIDPSYIITHRLPLDDAPKAFEMFNAKDENCIKVVLTP